MATDDDERRVIVNHQVVENYKAQLTATKTLFNGNIQIRTDGEWDPCIIVPEKKALIITNFWRLS